MVYTKQPTLLHSHLNARLSHATRFTLPSSCLPKHSSQVIFGIAITLALSACGGSSSNDAIPVDDIVPVPTVPATPTTPATPTIPAVPTNPISSIDPSTSDSCETDVQNQWVYNNMLDYYLFYDQVPQVNPQTFSSPEELLRAIRFAERDPFSFLTDAGAASLQFEEGREFGLGYTWARDDDGAPRLTSIVDDSPFGRAGLERGDTIITLNGIPWFEFPNDNFSENVAGSTEAPVTTTWQFEKRDTGDIVTVEVTAAEYSINTVLHTQRITNTSYEGTIGYLVFDRFLETSGDELQAVFQDFNDQNITDLVLDLRYNSGGRVVIAEFLASLIAGNSRANQTLYQYEFNDKYTAENYSLELLDNVGDLGLSRVVIITRGGTASSSEIVISGLKAHMEVVTIGTTTSGKPYVQRGRNRCGRQLNAIEAEGFNAAGVSVFGGVPATCYAKDDRTLDFGLDSDTRNLEGMLKSALDYIVFGTCESAPPQAVQPALAVQSRSTLAESQTTDSPGKQGILNIGGAIR